MSEFGRFKRLIRGQGGSTLVEFLVAMPLAILLMFSVLEVFNTGAMDQQKVERRTEAVGDAQRGVERMTRELRQATWVYFRNSQVVDLDALRRPTPTSEAVHRLVRYDCSAEHCVRLEGAPVSFPPPSNPTFDSSYVIVGGTDAGTMNSRGTLTGRGVFEPRRVNPVSGDATPDYLNPNLVLISLWLKVDGLERPVEIVDGVSLRNNSTFG